MWVEEWDAGKLVSAGSFDAFVPNSINHNWRWQSQEINAILARAQRTLGELNAFSQFAPYVEMYIHLLVKQEAVVSSKIEGTQTRIEEALMREGEIVPERRDDWQEVKNYTEALDYCVEALEQLPVSNRMIKNAHSILMHGVRGHGKAPGEYRKTQNWIGGATITDAVFVPPTADAVPDLMHDIELFLHNETIHVPTLIRTAIMHYQFETIHPFLDGNGRIGRLLITVYLIEQGILGKPLLYLSAFFENKKHLYYDNLSRVRTHNDLLQWLKYFLVGIEQTATDAVGKLKAMWELKQNMEQNIRNNWGQRTEPGLAIAEYLFLQPVVSVADVQTATRQSKPAASKQIEMFVEAGYLTQMGTRQRNRRFKFKPLLDMFED